MTNIKSKAQQCADMFQVGTKVYGETILCIAFDKAKLSKEDAIAFEREVWRLLDQKYNMIEFGNMGLGRMVYLQSLK